MKNITKTKLGMMLTMAMALGNDPQQVESAMKPEPVNYGRSEDRFKKRKRKIAKKSRQINRKKGKRK